MNLTFVKPIALPILTLIALFGCLSTPETDTSIFQKGSQLKSDHFQGNAWLQMLVEADSINRNAVGSVTFEPGARTNWHSHPNGQIILALAGKGFYQEKGSPKQILQKGDVVKCPPNTPHWHGASATSSFVQVAITSRVDGPTNWLQPVADETYHANATP